MATAAKTLGFIPRPTAETGFVSWLTTVDHKRIGIMYGVTAFLFFLFGGLEAFMIRLQLMKPNLDLVTADTFNALFTMHATTMIFLAIMPMLAAFMNFLLPLQIGARDVAFPRLNAFSYWSYLFGGLFINTSWLLQVMDPTRRAVPDSGWFGYANLTTVNFSGGMGPDFWTIGLLLLGIGTLVSGFNFITTILNMRAPGMSLMKMPIFSWTTLVTSVLVIFSFPAITVALLMLMFDRQFEANFFNVAAGGNVVFWQHLFWTFGHPEVYILILPAMGIVSEILPTYSRKPLFGYSVMVFSTALIGFMGFTVWSHHMFAVGMGPVVNTIFGLTTMAIAIPTGVKIFNWLSTMWGGRVKFTSAMLFALGFIMCFTIGGLSGFMHALPPSNAQQTDTYFIVAHIHYVLIGGSIFAIFGGIYHWFPKIFGRLMDEKLGKWNFWLMFAGFNLFAFPFHFLGLMGMPRRIYTYDAGFGWELWNMVSTIGVWVLTLGILLFIWNFVQTMRKPVGTAADPWDARTTEWTTSSPPPAYNFKEVPVISVRDDFWYKKYPEKEHAAGHGRGKAQTIAHAAGAVHEAAGHGGGHGIHMPGQSYMPALLALGITLLGYGLLFSNMVTTVIGVVGIFAGMFGWAFEGDGGTVIEVAGGDD
ncbi:MAG TPA: cytochrome c oxidase subunit I [Symbiobacteriaceae bacterium]|nr:cytochrome c oxidase subunit I [Symbiobacteriaceae bacterium]